MGAPVGGCEVSPPLMTNCTICVGSICTSRTRTRSNIALTEGLDINSAFLSNDGSLGTRPFAVEEGSGHVPTFELSPRNAIMRGN